MSTWSRCLQACYDNITTKHESENSYLNKTPIFNQILGSLLWDRERENVVISLEDPQGARFSSYSDDVHINEQYTMCDGWMKRISKVRLHAKSYLAHQPQHRIAFAEEVLSRLTDSTKGELCVEMSYLIIIKKECGGNNVSREANEP